MKQRVIFPFTAIVNQELMKLGLILNAINPSISGILIRGEKGTGKTTAVRALAQILPEIEVFEEDPFNLCPHTEKNLYQDYMKLLEKNVQTRPAIVKRKVKVVELPLGATEDRVVGTLDLEKAIKKGEKRISPGLLASCHRGILYVDEINLLEDHIVDILLDAAAMGINIIEREGISFVHPARFVLVGTMNPEEGELRPQLLDRFGLCVTVKGISDPEKRVELINRRLAFEEDPYGFSQQWEKKQKDLTSLIHKAKELYPRVKISEELMLDVVNRCISHGVDGHRADIVMIKTAKTLAAYHQRKKVIEEDVEVAAKLTLPHRARTNPFEEVKESI